MARLGKIATAKEKGTHCPICDEIVPIITLQENMCRECIKADTNEIPTCLYCNEKVEDEGSDRPTYLSHCCFDCRKTFHNHKF